MRTSNAMFVFFKDSLNKRAETLILELNEVLVYTLIRFKYWSGSLNMNKSFKKFYRILSLFLESKTPF